MGIRIDYSEMIGKGYQWNPLRRMLSKNAPCLCRSGRKFKRCCEGKLIKVVPENVALMILHSGSIERAAEIYLEFMRDAAKAMIKADPSIIGAL